MLSLFQRKGIPPATGVADAPPVDSVNGLLRPESAASLLATPQTEFHSHYPECPVARQFDRWVWFDETRAVTPLASGSEAAEDSAEPPELWPFGL